MRIGLAQIGSAEGDPEIAWDKHRPMIEFANCSGADLVLFPELSWTGYEPVLASDLAHEVDDARLNELQEFAEFWEIAIGIGVPLRSDRRAMIGFILFRPGMPRWWYAKRHLHPDEESLFSPGDRTPILEFQQYRIGLAICYELSVPAHFDEVQKAGADIYIIMAAKSQSGVEQAQARLQSVAREHQRPVCFLNSIGKADNFVAAGQSAIWDERGERMSRLNSVEESVLIYDTDEMSRLA